jgi:hypothetical protein
MADEQSNNDAACSQPTSSDTDVFDPVVNSQDVIDPEEEALERLYRVLSGSLDGDQLPPLHSKIVRIFTSSTFTGLPRSVNFAEDAL